MIEPRHVVIAGGGIAAAEAVLALHDLGAARLALTLVAPDDRFVLRPLAVAEPFGGRRAPRLALRDLLSERNGSLVRDTVTGVDAGARIVTCADGPGIGYDELLLVTGARTRPAFEDVLSFDGDPASLHGLAAEIADGRCAAVAFVIPDGPGWPLPAYELALQTAHAAAAAGARPAITVVSPESRPLEIFGDDASLAVADLLDAAGVRFVGDSVTQVGGGFVWTATGGDPVRADRVVALPLLEGPRLPGVPCDERGFIPVDDHGRVRGTAHVWAAGDATDVPVKHGSLACQLADVAAAAIAASAGAQVAAPPLRPVLRGRLMTGAGERSLAHAPDGGEIEPAPLWWPPAKISGRYLTAYLAAQGVLGDAPGDDVDIPLYVPPRLDARRLGLDPYSPRVPAGPRLL